MVPKKRNRRSTNSYVSLQACERSQPEIKVRAVLKFFGTLIFRIILENINHIG